MEVGLSIGKYEIVEIIKKEKERVTGKCRDRCLHRLWFCKFIPRTSSTLEFDHLLLLDHRRIPNVIDRLEADNGTYFIMDAVHGLTLDAYMNEHKVTLSECVTIWIHLCQILEHVHCMNIIHGDIKPENLIIDEHAGIHLVDFGSSFRGQDSYSYTFEYVAPERLLDTFMADERSDLYSLGRVMEDMLVNIHLYSLKDWWLKRRLKKCLKKCCEINPIRRYQCVLDLKEHLMKLMKT